MNRSSSALLTRSFAQRRGRRPTLRDREDIKVTLPPVLITRLEAETVRRFGDAHRPGTSYGKRSETIEQLLEEALRRCE